MLAPGAGMHCPALGLQEAGQHPLSGFFPAAWSSGRSTLSHPAEVCWPPEDGARECWREANGWYLFPWVQLFAQHMHILIPAACHMLTFLLYTMNANCSLLNAIVFWFFFISLVKDKWRPIIFISL